MNQEKCFYHEERGIWVTISDPSEEIRASYPEGTVEIPMPPSNMHKFDGTEWIAPTQQEIDDSAAAKIRIQRDKKLRNEVDPVVTNPLRWADMTTDQQQVWADYRRALLDIPQQPGFPHDVIWPTMPQS